MPYGTLLRCSRRDFASSPDTPSRSPRQPSHPRSHAPKPSASDALRHADVQAHHRKKLSRPAPPAIAPLPSSSVARPPSRPVIPTVFARARQIASLLPPFRRAFHQAAAATQPQSLLRHARAPVPAAAAYPHFDSRARASTAAAAAQLRCPQSPARCALSHSRSPELPSGERLRQHHFSTIPALKNSRVNYTRVYRRPPSSLRISAPSAPLR